MCRLFLLFKAFDREGGGGVIFLPTQLIPSPLREGRGSRGGGGGASSELELELKPKPVSHVLDETYVPAFSPNKVTMSRDLECRCLFWKLCLLHLPQAANYVADTQKTGFSGMFAILTMEM